MSVGEWRLMHDVRNDECGKGNMKNHLQYSQNVFLSTIQEEVGMNQLV